jgi:hypothetical protein
LDADFFSLHIDFAFDSTRMKREFTALDTVLVGALPNVDKSPCPPNRQSPRRQCNRAEHGFSTQWAI